MSGGAAAAIAAAQARRLRDEEEKMTKYGGDDLEGWEFKIVRSVTGKFKNREAVRRLCDEEARAGWEMLEKFDNNRIRFKRPIERRADDAHLELDPYRTRVGISEGMLAINIAIVCGLTIGLIALIVNLVK